MNAVMVENSMFPEDRIAAIEADVGELKHDLKALDARVSESIIANAREFGGLRADMEKGFGALRSEIEKGRAANGIELGALRSEIEKGRAANGIELGALRSEIEKDRSANAREFGALRTEIEKTRAEIEKSRADTERGFGSLRTAIESAKLWMLVTGVGSVILVTFISFLGRALKIL